jgi:hypothetical protein
LSVQETAADVAALAQRLIALSTPAPVPVP